MKTRVSVRNVLRLGAVLLLTGTATTWVLTGAHRGWSRTTVTEMQTDEITGIEYPVHRDGFVAGVEFLGGGVLVALALAGMSFLKRPVPERSA